MSSEQQETTNDRPTIAHAVLMQLLGAFEGASRAAFQRFIDSHHVKKWVIAFDYNWRSRDRPHDVVAVTIYPDEGADLQTRMSLLFPRDFKESRALSEDAIKWFRSDSAFHFCFCFEKRSSIFDIEGEERRARAKRSVEETLQFMINKKAPAHHIDNMSKFRELSRKVNFNHRLYSDIVLISILSSFITCIISQYRNEIEQIIWISDRDDRTEWADKILSSFILINTYQGVTWVGNSLAKTVQLFAVMRREGADPFDPLIRPPDYLAAAFSAWDFASGGATEPAAKYGQVLRDVIAENPQVVVLQLLMGDTLQAKRWEVRRLKLEPAGQTL